MSEAATQDSPSMELAKKGKKKASKNVAKAAKEGTLLQGDLISNTAHELETLKKEAAFTMVRELSENVDYTYFKLGGVLSVIQSNGWYHDESYDTFKAFVETEYGIHYRKAMYLVAIYNGLVESGVEWELVKNLGWTKLKELAHILTPDNAEEWVTSAESMSVIQLIEYIKEKAKGSLPSTEGAQEETAAKTLTNMTFKVHEDQKEIIAEAITKAKTEAGTEFDTVALEAVCLSFLSGGAKAPKAPKSLSQMMKDSTWEEVLEQFEKIWPDVNLSVEV